MKHGELGLNDERRGLYRVDIAKHYKVVPLREVMIADDLQNTDCPEKVAEFYRRYVATDDRYTGEVETMHVLFMNARRRCTGWTLCATGTLDTLHVHPREIFRAAIVANAAVVVLVHNHPSGDPTPSESDIKVTRDIVRAGQHIKIEVIDHVIIGNHSSKHTSLRELGYFYS